METIFAILITGALCIACFFVGAKVGQKVSKGEEIELPSLDPMKPIREHQERKKAKEEQNRYETIMKNIDNYDGTSNRQEDVPR
jgi:hypothetical protein